jgi:ubiquinone biosynthesis protein
MGVTIAVGPERLQGAIQVFLDRFPGAEERVRAVEGMLNSPAGRLWRAELAKWTTTVIPVSDLVPDAHREWRPLVRDAMRFVVHRLSAARLAPKIVEQMEIPAGVPADVRLLKLIAKVPGLQKIGQTVARNRHVEPRFRAALSQLENSISDVTATEIRGLIRNELGARLAAYRVRLAGKVLSEASVSAVVAFTWLSPETRRRERGVFKVLKPHVPSFYAEDMDILRRLASHLGKRHRRHQSRFAGVAETLGDVMHLLEREVDFRGEQVTLRDSLPDYRSIPGVRVPSVIEPLCTDTITAMGYEDGAKITDAAAREPRKRTSVAERLVEAVVGVPVFSAKQDAVFHADPHAGNLLYDRERGDIVILDWALAERLTRAQRRHLVMLGLMTTLRDPSGVADAIEGLRLHGGSNDAAWAERSRERVANFIDGLPFSRLAGPMDAMRLLDRLGHEGMRFPASLAMFRKATFTLDGVVEDVAGAPVPIDAIIRRYAAAHWGRSAAVLLSVLTPWDWAALQWSAFTFLSRAWLQALRPSPVPVSIG